MSLDEYEPTLEHCAETGQIDHEKWPAILDPLLERLNHIAYNDFPVPRPYPIINPVLPSQRSSDPDRFIDNPPILPSQAPVTPNTPRTLPPVPPFPSSNTSRVPESQTTPADAHKSTAQAKEQLPAEVLQVLNGALSSLRTTFSQKPPHTIQRLSELVLYPRKHYRTLPAWLRALDRVVSVSSDADVFPLSDIPPQLNNGVGGINGTEIGGILFANSSNEIRNGYDREALGSDESLGGALLTPIPWLKETDTLALANSGDSENAQSARNKVADWQDNGVDDEDFIGDTIIDTAATIADAQAIAAVAEEHANNADLGPAREDGGVTQGELIRMEQEAGVVPVPHEDIGRIGDDEFEINMEDEGDDMPHARGPDVVGTVDMGLVGGQEKRIRISSPPGENGSNANADKLANDAQKVLAGGHEVQGDSTTETAKEKTDNNSDGSVHGPKNTESTPSKRENDESISNDGDIVLVDADGVQATDPKKADTSGVNIGADAADSTVQ